MDIAQIIRCHISQAVEKIFDIKDDVNFSVDLAKKPEFGDFATNVAFILVKIVKETPVKIAEKIAKELQNSSGIANKIEVVSGFINIFLKHELWQELLVEINEKHENFGKKNIGNGKHVHLEYVSANPTGPLHLGHVRGAVIFDTLASALQASGFEVVKEYYINDAGKQIETLIKSIQLRYLELITDKEIEKFPENCYPGEYIKDLAEAIKNVYGDKLLNSEFENFKNSVERIAIEYVMELVTKDLQRLSIKYDVFTSEKKLHSAGYIEKSLQILSKKDLLAQEELEKPKNADKDWQARKQLVFLAKNFGDDENRALQKSDGSYTYFASDLAYHFYKLERGFKNMVIGLGADHAGYVKRLKAAVAALSNDEAQITVKLYNLVNLFNNGEPVKLSKRKGNIISLSDLTDAGITPSEIRFTMLTRSGEMILDFDIAKFLESPENNPIFYVQYASARAYSVLNKHGKEIENGDVRLLILPEEKELIKSLARWPAILQTVAEEYEVHKIVFYLQEVAEKFHSLWNLGMQDQNFRFIIEGNEALTESRLFLVKAAKNVIKAALSILKIEQMNKM